MLRYIITKYNEYYEWKVQDAMWRYKSHNLVRELRSFELDLKYESVNQAENGK